jgi:hypothetical protein
MNGKLIKWLAVVMIGVATLLLYWPRSHHSRIDDVRGFETLALAEALAAHHGFSDPFMPMRTGPSAHMPPLYPAYLALIMVIFGNGTLAAKVIIGSALLFLALQLMLFPFLAENLGLGFWTGGLAALAWMAAGIPPSYTSESNYIAVLAMGASLVMMASYRREFSRKEIILSSLLWGFLLLMQPVAIAVLACWLLLLWLKTEVPRAKIAAMALLPITVVAPWMVRNFLVFHRPVFIRDNLGLELAVSNNPCATALFEDNDRNGCFGATHPNINYQEALRARQLGEVEYNRVRLKEAVAWITSNPRAFAILTAKRFQAFWLPPPSLNPGNGIIYRPIVVQLCTLLSLPGLFLLWRNNRAGAYVLLSWLLCFPPIYYFVQFLDRYRAAIFWVTFLAGSYFITEMVSGVLGLPASSNHREGSMSDSAQYS